MGKHAATWIGTIAGLLLCLPGMAADAPAPAPAGSVNSAPLVVPGLQQWQGGKGRWQPGARLRLRMDAEQGDTLQPVAERLADDLQALTGHRPQLVRGSQGSAQDIVLRLDHCGASTTVIGAEGYTLDVGDHVVLCANTATGLFYASRTLLQMLVLDGASGQAPGTLPRGRAVDFPRYRERSVMLDVGRKFADVSFLQNYLRFMGWYKLNTLHLHLNDQVLSDDKKTWASRAFRLKSDNPAFAKLVPEDGHYYTRQDWDALERTAAANGVTLVPEIDTPGHSGAFVLARPDLAYPGDTPAGGTLDPANPASLVYVESVFAEFLPWFHSHVVHMGGDEVNLNGGKISLQAQVDFLNQLGHYLQQHGKQVELWGSADMADRLDKSFVIQRWINWGDEAKIDWGQHGFPWVESFGDWYIVPFGPSYFNPNGLRGDALYDGWNKRLPHNGDTEHGPQGGQIAVWNDKGAMEYDYASTVHGLLKDAIPAAGQVFWRGQALDAAGQPVGYARLRPSIAWLQYGPGVTAFKDAPL